MSTTDSVSIMASPTNAPPPMHHHPTRPRNAHPPAAALFRVHIGNHGRDQGRHQGTVHASGCDSARRRCAAALPPRLRDRHLLAGRPRRNPQRTEAAAVGGHRARRFPLHPPDLHHQVFNLSDTEPALAIVARNDADDCVPIERRRASVSSAPHVLSWPSVLGDRCLRVSIRRSESDAAMPDVANFELSSLLSTRRVGSGRTIETPANAPLARNPGACEVSMPRQYRSVARMRHSGTLRSPTLTESLLRRQENA